MINEAGSEVIEEMISCIDFSKQQCSGVRSDGATVEIGYDFSRSKA
jgi:hypothetical protein